MVDRVSIFNRRKKQARNAPQIAVVKDWGDVLCSGYTSLDKCPEVMTACRKIAQLIGSTTIHLMSNTEDGDKRIVNELSRKIDIDPMPTMTRTTWMESIVMNLLLYGRGNSVVVPHTWEGYIQSLEPISADRVGFVPIGYRDYRVLIDGAERKPDRILHFTYNPDPHYLWKGRGVHVSLRDIADSLKQAAETEKAFMSSEYKPALVVKIDALIDELDSPEGRQKLVESYIKTAKAGEPWLIPADQIDIEQIRPLTLGDLAISDTVKLNKKMIAAIIGVPPFICGVGEYNKDEWNVFIQTTIMSLCKAIAAELTKKLLTNPQWYFSFNVWSLMDYDLKTVSSVLLAGADRGYVNGDEWRDRMHMNPAGLKEFKVLENYIPIDMIGQQKKLVQEGE